MAQRVKRLSAMQDTRVRLLSREDPLEKEMATHSSTLAWKIPWMEEPSRLQSIGWQRVGHESDFTFTFPFSLTAIPATSTTTVTTSTETFTEFLLGTWDCSVWSI